MKLLESAVPIVVSGTGTSGTTIGEVLSVNNWFTYVYTSSSIK